MIETKNETTRHRFILHNIARRAMFERGMFPDFPVQVLSELDKIQERSLRLDKSTSDLRHLNWCSIDNDDSQDLDQLTFAEAVPGGVKVLVAIADVDAWVKKQSAIDEHASHNTTSIYTAAEIFPMLPEKLSTDFTSLKYEADRLAIIVEMIIAEDGSIKKTSIYRALVRNHAKLSYVHVARWLDGEDPLPQNIKAVYHLEESLKLQDTAARKMKTLRHQHGALNLNIIKTHPLFEMDEIKDLQEDKTNRAKDIIADFMIAVNGVTARFLASRNLPSIRRVVRTPKRWDRIIEIAAENGYKLPQWPDAIALDQFLVSARMKNPELFTDLSLSIVKLLGAGEYVIEKPGDDSIGHFGLAVRDYSHSTAPNRRYPDLIMQRLLKAALENHSSPYETTDLELIARHCTEAENSVKKIERQVEKAAAALLLESRIGEQFDSIVTGASEKGTWVRLLHPPVEGKLVTGYEGLDVGQRLRVQLISTDVDRGFIDLKKV